MKTRRFAMARRHFKLSTILAFCSVIILLFQNFNDIPLSKLKPEFAAALARPESPTDGSADMRKLAPSRPHDATEEKRVIAAPQTGSNLEAVSQDWMMRQTNLITGGAEQRFLNDVNKRLNRIVTKKDPTEADATAAADDKATNKKGSRGPASIGPAQIADEKPAGFKPTSLRVMSINRVQLGLANNTQFSCSFEGSNLRWDVSHPLGKTFDVNVRHETAESKSSLHLNYNW